MSTPSSRPFKAYVDTLINEKTKAAIETSKYCETFVRDFIENNLTYVHDHYFDDKDIDIAMSWTAAINDRFKQTEGIPQKGDIVHIYGKDGKEYKRARITEGFSSSLSICTQPHVPFIFRNKSTGEIGTSISGGYFMPCFAEKLELIGQTTAQFMDWGRKGAGAHQAIYFNGTVNHWKTTDDRFY